MSTLSDVDLSINWHPYTQMLHAPPPLCIVRGEGSLLYDQDGHSYIDAIASWWVCLHGHNHPHLMEGLRAQTRQLDHVIFAGCTHPKAVELSERLLHRTPQHRKVFYSDNGSTAVEVGIKMALQYWYNQGQTKPKLIAFHNAYHGDTFGVMSVSARSPFTAPFDPQLFEVHFIDAPTPGNEEASRQQLQQLLEQHNDIAAFVFEPLIQGAGGMIMHTPQALDALIQLCKQYHVLTIADEVMTGFGRTGKWFASDWLTHTPDILCLSKGLTGGTMALAATLCTEAIYDVFLSVDKQKAFFHGHSFMANPLACAISVASMDVLESEACWEDIRRIEGQHEQFRAQLEGVPSIRSCRQQGVVLALELATSEGSGYFNTVREQVAPYFLQRGILLRPLGNVLYILPPYCITNEQLQQVYSALLEFAQ